MDWSLAFSFGFAMLGQGLEGTWSNEMYIRKVLGSSRYLRCKVWVGTMKRYLIPAVCLATLLQLAVTGTVCLGAEAPQTSAQVRLYQLKSLRLAIRDLIETSGEEYPRGREYLKRLDVLESAVKAGDPLAMKMFVQLRRDALLANPLLDFGQLLVVKRRCKDPRDPGFPSNHECNSSLRRTGYDNEIAVLSPIRPDGKLTTFYRPKDGGYVGEIDLHWDADRILFTKSDSESWKIWEIRTNGTGLRQVSRVPEDVDCFDACYMPNGRIIFGSTASYQSVPCWHGQKLVSNLYVMNADGADVRQVCFDQDHDFHPVMLFSGQVLYHRWDYTGISHIFFRQLMVMNPDGTGQRAVYGSNSWFPNSLYFPRPLPGYSEKLICILSGYHGVHRMGQLILVDTSRGWYETDGLVQRISGKGQRITRIIRDNLVDNDWPKFLHPYPLSDKYFLVSCWKGGKDHWGIYLADVFDNLVLVREEIGYALLEPVALKKTAKPALIPDRVESNNKDGTVYLHNIYAGPGLEGVPRGAVKKLRVFAYHFGYRGLAGPDKIGFGGPWEVMRILGTVPVEKDGSAMFRVPAQTALAVQPLDVEGKAIQLMRSWFTVIPGEVLSCAGCHESPAEVARSGFGVATQREARDIMPWYGPARGFDFAREVQPVLNKYCISCHDGQEKGRPDLRPEEQVKNYMGRRISDLGVQRLHPRMKRDTNGMMKYTPAYDVLISYIRRVSIEDDVSMLIPGEYHADTSELVQMLQKGHQGVRLDGEAWDRLVTWIDLNGPCHGTWGEVYPIPNRAHERRMELRQLYGGPEGDPEAIPRMIRLPIAAERPNSRPKVTMMTTAGWPVGAEQARQKHRAAESHERCLDLGGGVKMKLVWIPAGYFVMGDTEGEPDEHPLSQVTIEKPFWMGVYEVTNEQFRRFEPSFDCRYYGKRHARSDDEGLPLNGPNQPVVRVSWEQAMAFCRWLSSKSGMAVTLPTEAQWEYACRAGTATVLYYGQVNTDFSRWANVGDKAFSRGYNRDGKQFTGGLEHMVLEGAALADARFDDGSIVTAPVGSYKANAWGLCDMHGNVAEWTRSSYRTYPYREDDGRNNLVTSGHRVVRGGSFFDRPKRCRSAFRLSYPAWQRVFNVGFRIVCEDEGF